MYPLNKTFLILALLILSQLTFGINKDLIPSNKNKPFGFQENKGQFTTSNNTLASFVLFKAEAPGLNIWVTETGLTYQFFKLGKDKSNDNKTIYWNKVNMIFKGGSIKKENILKKDDITQGNVNYYLAHCPEGIFNVKTFSKIIVKNVYPGIDWILYSTKLGKLKQDFIVHPGVDAKQIELIYEGNGNIDIRDNQIQFTNSLGEIKEGELICYQESKIIPSRYKAIKNKKTTYLDLVKEQLNNSKFNNTNSFSYSINIQLPNYDQTKDLLIDPELVWGTLFGGNSLDGIQSIDIDNNGNIFGTGYTFSTMNFPVQTSGNYFQGTNVDESDLFIVKFNNSGILEWSTYYGGTTIDAGNSISVDPFGNVWITGETESDDFPTEDAGTFIQSTFGGSTNAIILKFDNAGDRLWATYFGGNLAYGKCITSDLIGNTWITGEAGSGDLLNGYTGSSHQSTFGGGLNDAFLLKFDNIGNLTYATYYGGTGREVGYALTTDDNNNVWVTGAVNSTNFPTEDIGTFNQLTNGGGSNDAFILKFDNMGNRLWATYFGGAGTDEGSSIVSDENNNIWVLGETSGSLDTLIRNFGSTSFQGTYGGGTKDAFILKLDNQGNLLHATYNGGSGDERLHAYDNLAVDNCNNVYVSLETFSPDMLTKNPGNCHYNNNFGGTSDGFITMFDTSTEIIWSTYIGGVDNDFISSLAVDEDNDLFVGGEFQGYSTSTTLPLVNFGSAYFDDSPNNADDSFFLKFIQKTTSTSITTSNSNCNVCDGDAIVNTCGTPPFSYNWDNGSQTTINTLNTTDTITGLCSGNHNVIITSNCNNSDTLSFNIGGLSNVNTDFSYSSSTFCLNDTSISPTITGELGGIFSITPGTIDPTSGEIDISVNGIGVYVITYTVNGICSDSSSVNLEIIDCPLPEAIFSISDSSICKNDCIDLFDMSLNADQWSWSFNGGSPASSTDQNPINICFSDTGLHQLQLITTNSYGSDTASYTINIINTHVDAGEDVIVNFGDNVNLTPSGTTGEISWSPSSWLSCTECSTPISTPNETITYSVTVTDINGCTAQDEIIISVINHIYIPTAFTPNGDNTNESFFLAGSGLDKKFIIRIYDRWGQVVFESDQPSKKWDGTKNGKILPNGVYSWRLSYAGKNNNTVSLTGHVNLIR